MDPIGIREGHNLLRKATQSKLSLFHVAGTVFSGARPVPAVHDIIDACMKPTNTSMILTFGNEEVPSELARDVLCHRKLLEFVVLVRGSITGFPEWEDAWYKVLQRDRPRDVVRLYLSFKKMKKFGLTLDVIGSRIIPPYVDWVCSPDFMGMIDIFTSSRYTISDAMELLDLAVTVGKPSVSDLCVMPDNKIMTFGSNILLASRLRSIVHIDSNDILDVERCFGIEAARNKISRLLESDIIADFMTKSGRILSYTKFGSQIQNRGVLESMSFERPKYDLTRALADGTEDKALSIYTKIMLGCTDLDRPFELRPDQPSRKL